jgi:hypothetical protein
MRKLPGRQANELSRRRKINWHQIMFVARANQSAIDGCNKAYCESYFDRDLVKFSKGSSTPSSWRVVVNPAVSGDIPQM